MSDTPALSRSREHETEAGLFRNRGFMLLWAAYGISAMGDHISEMALLKKLGALEATNLTQLEALITFMFMLPFFVLGPFTGLLADRLPRRGIMIFADLVRAALMFNFAYLVTAFGRLGEAHGFTEVGAFVPLLIVGIFAALFSPSRSALLPTLIRQDQLVRANAMTSGLGVISTMIAVLIGGYLADHYRAEVSFHVDAGTFLASALLLALIRPPAREIHRHHAGAGPAALAEIIRYVRSHRRVIQLIVVAVVVWSCGGLVRSTMPAIVRDVFHRPNYTEISGFQARLGLGMLTGAIILTMLGGALRSEIAITWSLAGTAASIGLLAFSCFAPISATTAYHLGGAAVICSGIFATGVMASYNALMQRIVPNRLRGRLFGITDLVTMAGLLLATGLLGIPRWQNIDRWVGWILVAVALVVLATAIGSLTVRLRASPFHPKVAFWWNLNEFYCKWWFRLRRMGRCTVPAEGPVIVIANHTASNDPLLLIASVSHRVLGFVIAEEYHNIPLFGRLTHMIECVPVKRNGEDIAGTKAALRHLKAGKPLGVFIEGRIVRPGEQVAPKEGAALFALRTGATVVPAFISGTRYDKGVAMAFVRRHHARVRFGKPIDLSPWQTAKPDKETLAALSTRFMQAIQELKPETDPQAGH
ncbi:MAG: MFS transporter [Phycisphaerae bacterium]|nr:MFS transporter [Phycisphaerae bacterium]